MAFWMTHLRVAEAVRPRLPDPPETFYYAGAIGPDCGRTETDADGTTRYVPGRVVNHWMEKPEGSDRWVIRFDRFYDAVMPKADSEEKRAFYWGYYIHLVTDSMWQEHVLKPRKEILKEVTGERMREMKADMYRADLRFYRSHPHYPPLEILRNVDRFPNVYLGYYNGTDLENRIRDFPEQYARDSGGEIAESLWLSDEELDEFVLFATAKCIRQIRIRLGE